MPSMLEQQIEQRRRNMEAMAGQGGLRRPTTSLMAAQPQGVDPLSVEQAMLRRQRRKLVDPSMSDSALGMAEQAYLRRYDQDRAAQRPTLAQPFALDPSVTSYEQRMGLRR